MKTIIVATIIAGALFAQADPALAKAVKLADAQLDRITAGGSVFVGANGSASGGLVIDTTTAMGNGGALVGYGVSLSFGANGKANVTVGGSSAVYTKTLSGGTGPIAFKIGVVAAL